jgi:hypothetical protein
MVKLVLNTVMCSAAVKQRMKPGYETYQFYISPSILKTKILPHVGRAAMGVRDPFSSDCSGRDVRF